MISPCHECTRRTAVPNCHGACEEYQAYTEWRAKMRTARSLQREGDDARIRILDKRKRNKFLARRK